ncbi:hybrid sensor histidine kinase/response regulator [Schlesneria sp.]|uniref:hybrid sensor histidine kinase/response regulator n=1 Tax=Schlesneria sp. TaxID=2762018 RepID=UPI002F21ACBE
MTDRIEEFIIEAREHLSLVEDSLLTLEKHPTATERIDRCFRSIHSIKGDAGFLGLLPIHDLAHAMESLLVRMRLPVAPSAIETLLAARDRLATLVDNANQNTVIDFSDILQRLSTEGIDRETIPLEIDLTARSQAHPGGLMSFFRQLISQGRIHDGRITINPCNLRDSLPDGPVTWSAVIEAPAVMDSAQSQDEASDTSSTEETTGERLSVDLSAWSATNGGLVRFFRDLASFGPITEGELQFAPVDLRNGLPSAPIVWTGSCRGLHPHPAPLQVEDTAEQTHLDAPQAIGPAEERQLDPVNAEPPSPPNSPSQQVTRRPPSMEGEKSTTLRIQVELLDRMMTLVGELTLVRNQALLAFADEDGSRRAIIQRLSSVTSELQDVTLRARMQPVGNLFNKYPRMVRDLARQLGKQVELDLQGRDVELDKSILEQLSDPLMHLIRNSVDHGIELPEERIAQGKSPIGRIVLSASHEDGQVHIQIQDDGKGIDPEAVKIKALSLGLKTESELTRMTPREIYALVLMPGFSTAAHVTEVSGRGVGMDVVKTNIELLEGTLSIDSVVGHGCSTALRLPLTLAIIPCLIVTVGGESFAVPQRDLEEVVCLHPRSSERIEQAFNTEVYRLRDKLLPVVRFAEVLTRKEPFSVTAKAEILTKYAAKQSPDRIEYILVLKLGGRRFGLVVDDVKGTQEIVVKPMHPSMKRVGIFTGATIMGDGRVALIADVEGIIEHAQLSFEPPPAQPEKASSVREAAQAHRVLIFEYGPQERFALPLIQIRRIEMVSQHQFERVGNFEYVTVDGVSTRILRLNHVINVSAPDGDAPVMSLILPKFVAQPMGILVSRIVDTESLALDLQQFTDDEPGILGSAIVRDRLTLFLDMHHIAEKLFGIAPAEKQRSRKETKCEKRLLLIDDTAFFREVVKRYLTAEGYEVVTAINGEDGLDRLNSEDDFDLIVSDIEMPVMDGWDFAREVRRRGVDTPLLALTSLSGAEYEAKAKDCGYSSYEVKLDHDRLIRKVSQMVDAREAVR